MGSISDFFQRFKHLDAQGPEQALVDAMCLSVCADGEVTDHELMRAQELASQLPGLRGQPQETIDGYLERSFSALRLDGFDGVMKNVARTLREPAQREEAFTLAALVQYADGRIEEVENQFLAALRDAFQIAPDRADAIVADVEKQLYGE
jgi:tellurite resistance protein